MRISPVFKWIENISPSGWRVIAGLLFILISMLDYVTGAEVAFSLFYLLPIVIIVWFWSRTAGLVASLLAAGLWLAADLLAGHTYSHPLIPLWNSLVRLAFFAIITLLLSTLQAALHQAQELSRTDPVTGALNTRAFTELLQAEIERSRRTGRPFTLAYCDVDNFKAVNDRYGHQAGDEVLKAVVCALQEHSRANDIVARLGGDEFAVLLIETEASAGRAIVERLRQDLLDKLRSGGRPVTVSMGAVTFEQPPASANEAIRRADELMYEVKRGSKDGVRYDAA